MLFVLILGFFTLQVGAINHCGWRTSPDIDYCCQAHFGPIAHAETVKERVAAASDFCGCLKKTIVANAEIWSRMRTNLLCDVRTLGQRTEGKLPNVFLKGVRKLFQMKGGHDEEDDWNVLEQ